MISVLQIFRKKNPVFFSIEKVFALIRPGLAVSLQLNAVSVPYYSHGLVSIFRNLYFARHLPASNVYHVTGDVHYTVLALPASKTILTIHDCVFLHTTTGFKRKILKWLFLDLPVKHAAVITTISEFTREEILRFTNCDPDKVLVIPNPVNENIVFKEKDFNTAKPFIFFIGTTPNKNLERTVAALQGISCHLGILGNLNNEQEQLLNTSKIDYSVCSNVTEEQLSGIYAQTDILLFPSTFEGFGLPILEAQKAGRVVITSNASPMKNVAGDGAVLVDPYDTASIRNAVQTIIADTARRNDCISRGFHNINNYSAPAISAAYDRLYQSMALENEQLN